MKRLSVPVCVLLILAGIDLAVTMVATSFDPELERNPLAQMCYAETGVWGLATLKLGTLAVAMFTVWLAMRRQRPKAAAIVLIVGITTNAILVGLWVIMAGLFLSVFL